MPRLAFTVLCALGVMLAFASAVLGVDRGEMDAGDRLMAAQRYEEALTCWKRLLEAEPGNPELLLRAGLAESMLDRFPQAEALLTQAHAAAPDDPKIALNLALLTQRRGRTDEAERLLLELAARKPWYPNVFLSLGRIAEERGEVEKAMDYYIREINNSSHGDAWRHYLLLKRKLDGPAREPPPVLLPALAVLAALLAIVLVVICVKHPEKLERFVP